jgi:hypothetical protein
MYLLNHTRVIPSVLYDGDTMTTDKTKGANEQLGVNNEIAKNIARAIESSYAMFYSKEGEISLLTAPARVLITLILQPGMTRRAISLYLGLTEAAIQKSLVTLMEHGLIAKTKVGSKNIYEINSKMLFELSDIHHILSAISLLRQESSSQDPF